MKQDWFHENSHLRSISTLVLRTVASKLEVSHVSWVCKSLLARSIVRLLLTT